MGVTSARAIAYRPSRVREVCSVNGGRSIRNRLSPTRLAWFVALMLAASTALVVTPAAAATGEVLILGPTVTGGLSSNEANAVTALGKTPVVVDAATWGAMTTAQFALY